jgi:hypothetical protein
VIKRLGLATFALLALTCASFAQTQICYKGTSGINCVPVSAANPLPTTATGGQYPSGAVPLTGNGTGTTGAVVGTLTAVAGKTTYICGLNVSATGGTAAVGPITVANTITGSLVFELNASVAGNNISENFNPCIPANAANTNITTTTTADGTASAVAVNSWGFNY